MHTILQECDKLLKTEIYCCCCCFYWARPMVHTL